VLRCGFWKIREAAHIQDINLRLENQHLLTRSDPTAGEEQRGDGDGDGQR